LHKAGIVLLALGLERLLQARTAAKGNSDSGESWAGALRVQMNLSFTKTPSLRTSVVTAHASSLELLVWPCVFTGLRCWSVVREIDGLQLQDMRDWRMDEA